MERMLSDWPELHAATPPCGWGLYGAAAASAEEQYFLSALLHDAGAGGAGACLDSGAQHGSEGTELALAAAGVGECSGGDSEACASPASPASPQLRSPLRHGGAAETLATDAAAARASLYRCLDRNHTPDCTRCTEPPSLDDSVLFFLRGSKGVFTRGARVAVWGS
jgi:hypothetical protein